ncbi:hypothetical protein VE04_09768 [Pseudogymnoascus sp. 24MN13]|nr:hypothetical protein VE04_09768 [Pseudogymnoascus sp. 24MN13]
MSERPQNIGIKAIEIYFPSQCVDQAELEKFDGVSQGKYTIGLGQTKMSFCDDREDIYSFALTVTANLLSKYKIDPNSIGRLEVGTETMLDKSKSVKSVLMQLFGSNSNIEGVDTINACYGGTNAFLNSVNWIESSGWDGRDAIVVAGDIALYAKGNARPTGGAGAVAMLIGPNAPVVVEPGLRGSYMQHAYDFYKPDLTSEYPIVDGHFSISCYTEAVDACYKAYNAREATLKKLANGHANGHANGVAAEEDASKTPLDRFDYMTFHAPTCKLVAKSYARLLYNDYLTNPTAAAFADVPSTIADLDYKTSITDKSDEETVMALATGAPRRARPAFHRGAHYVRKHELQGKRIGVFSYGSGLASSLLSLRVAGPTGELAKQVDLKARLAARRTVKPEVYDELCDLRKKAHLQKGYKPAGSAETVVAGTYYLEEVDELFRRKYSIKA